MQLSFKADNYAEFQHTVSILNARLNSKPHIVTVVIEDVDEIVPITPEARGDLDSLIAETTGTTDKQKTQ